MPPIFGRAAITLGIVPRSSFCNFFMHRLWSAYVHRFSCLLLVKNLPVLCRYHSTFICRTLTVPSRRKTRCCPRLRASMRRRLARCRLSTWQGVQHQSVVSRRRGVLHDDQIVLWILLVTIVRCGYRAVRRRDLQISSSVMPAVRQIPSTWNYLRVFDQINLPSIMDS